ncbi:MAG: dinitrogenase iron-molybdenum cofactor biosynthesis protein [Candidatus Eisenbacteria bacterium]|nr:dinitrogenase iron-molybdenum cofactor biosynthesis protein [Candidatus Eisenbacteria bacterium]
MRVGIPIWNEHVSPVLDAAERLLVIEFEDGKPDRTETRRLARASAAEVGASVRGARVDVLICGALSAELARILAGSETRVVPWVTGTADEVARAFIEGTLGDPRFSLPGCRRGFGGKRRRRRGGGVGGGGRRR